ncbi:MAG: hypothetical protein KA795_09045 [Burkholderiaceae bacterium]|nr:hypothetical protein [Burkholderiaceae bacterium]
MHLAAASPRLLAATFGAALLLGSAPLAAQPTERWQAMAHGGCITLDQFAAGGNADPALRSLTTYRTPSAFAAHLRAGGYQVETTEMPSKYGPMVMVKFRGSNHQPGIPEPAVGFVTEAYCRQVGSAR